MKLKPYPKYKDSEVQWIGEIPEEWELERFKIRFKTEKGKIPENLDVINGEGYLPYLSMEYLRGKEDNVLFSNDKASLKVEKGDLLLLWDGSNAGEFISAKRGFLSSTMVKLSIEKMDNTFSKYLCYTFEPMLRDLTIGMGIPHVNGDILGNIQIPIFEIKEQEKITDFLDSKTSEISKTIEADKKLIELLKEKRTALINHVVTKGLNPKTKMKYSGIEWIGEVPEWWEVKKIKFFTTEKRNKATDTDNSGQFVGLENIESMTGKLASYNSTENLEGDSLKFKKDNVLFCKLRPYLAKVIVSETDGFCTSELIIYECDKNTNPSFLKYRLLSKAYIDYVNSLTEGVKMPRADPILLSNIKLPFPPKSEQLQISQYLDKSTSKIDQTVKKIEEKIELLEEFKKSLIHHVVTGKVDVREAMA